MMQVGTAGGVGIIVIGDAHPTLAKRMLTVVDVAVVGASQTVLVHRESAVGVDVHNARAVIRHGVGQQKIGPQVIIGDADVIFDDFMQGILKLTATLSDSPTIISLGNLRKTEKREQKKEGKQSDGEYVLVGFHSIKMLK